MLTVPRDLLASTDFSGRKYAQGSIVSYTVARGMQAESVFVSDPTLVIIRKGLKQFSTSSSAAAQLASEGMLLAFRSGVYVMSEFGADGRPYESLVISLKREFLVESIGRAEESLPEAPTALSVPLSQEELRRLEEISESIWGSKSETEWGFRFREFLVLAMGHLEVRNLLYREIAGWRSTVEERLTRVMRLHGLSPLRVEDFANLCGMSLASFKRHFREVFHASPGTWLRELRLRHAHSLVVNSKLNVGEICEASGYKDVSGYTRAFTQKFGLSPMAARHGMR